MEEPKLAPQLSKEEATELILDIIQKSRKRFSQSAVQEQIVYDFLLLLQLQFPDLEISKVTYDTKTRRFIYTLGTNELELVKRFEDFINRNIYNRN